MTEYDYSPEAFEAHMEKQRKIARWIETTTEAYNDRKAPNVSIFSRGETL